MAAEIIAILDHEGVDGEVVGIAHDWGTYLLSRLATFHGDRFTKLAFISVPFGRPGVKGDVHAINEKTKKKLGYEQLGYQVWFAEEEAGKIISQHVRPLSLSLSLFLLYPPTP